MSFDGHAASSSGCAIKPKAHVIGSAAFVGRTGISLRTGSYAMATAEHREPCDSRGSCTVLGAPGGESPPGDSTITDQGRPTIKHRFLVCCTLNNRRNLLHRRGCPPCARSGPEHTQQSTGQDARKRRSLCEVPVSSRFRVHRTRTATKLIISILIIVRAPAIKAFGLATASLHWRLSADGRLHFGIL